MVGVEIMIAPQLLQVNVSYTGSRSSDFDACIATLQTGQGFSGGRELSMREFCAAQSIQDSSGFY
jgi:hypothetical protein